MLSSFTFFW